MRQHQVPLLETHVRAVDLFARMAKEWDLDLCCRYEIDNVGGVGR